MNLPRHSKHPIDSSVYNRMMHRPVKKLDKIGEIRKAIKDVTGADPYMDPSYRGTKYVTARQLFLYFVHKHAGLTQDEAGMLLCKDHSTVVHAVKNVNKFNEIETTYKENFDKIKLLINN